MHPLLIAALVLAAYMTLGFIVSLVRKDNGIADIAYGGGFMLLALTTYALGPASIPGLILSILVFIWGLRLSLRILKRNWNRPEDFRYAAWRKEWGHTFVVRSFLQVYMLQGAVIFIVSLPVMIANLYGESTVVLLTMIGVAIWVIGFFFEAEGDRELDAFMRSGENKGKLMTRGLWKYTRHPNYFGESVMWWGIAVAALSLLSYGIAGFVGFLSPILITFLLLKVSGIPMLEKKMQEHPDWSEYARKTSAFIPLPPKR